MYRLSSYDWGRSWSASHLTLTRLPFELASPTNRLQPANSRIRCALSTLIPIGTWNRHLVSDVVSHRNLPLTRTYAYRAQLSLGRMNCSVDPNLGTPKADIPIGNEVSQIKSPPIMNT